jgi:hypothetical protein
MIMKGISKDQTENQISSHIFFKIHKFYFKDL